MGESVYETVLQRLTPSGPKIRSTARNAVRNRSWPNPFKNSLKNIDVVACEHTWQALIEFAFQGFGEWAFSAFVPSPVELTRKFVAGSYKCGFYSLPGFASPLDIIWRDASTSQVFAEIASPLTKSLFYFWAGSTAFSFLNTWSTLIHRGAMCEANGNECLLAEGVAVFPGGDHHDVGEAGLYGVIYDPKSRYPQLGGGPADNFDSYCSATAVGQFITNGSSLSNIGVWIYSGSEGQRASLGSMPPNSVKPFSVSFAGNVQQQQPITVRYECDVQGTTILPNLMQVNRFSTSFGAPKEPPPPGRLFDYTPKDYMCLKLYEEIYATGLG